MSRQGYSGADWLRANKKELSEFGAKAADLIGDWQRGIYHIHNQALRADWSNDRWVSVSYPGYLSTFDWNDLTRLVILAHDRCIRVMIEPNMRYLKITMHPRTRGGDLYNRHDTIEDAISRVRNEYGEPLEVLPLPTTPAAKETQASLEGRERTT